MQHGQQNVKNEELNCVLSGLVVGSAIGFALKQVKQSVFFKLNVLHVRGLKEYLRSCI